MKQAASVFLDTSVLIAATLKGHSLHMACLALVAELEQGSGFCAIHSLAELYSVLTRSPRPNRLPPNDALAVVELVCKRMTVVFLDADESLAIIREFAGRGLSGGIVHDGLILRCALKVDARKIYTLNAKHFKLAAPDLAERILEP